MACSVIRRTYAMGRLAFVMVEIVALVGVVASMASPIWTGRWRTSRRHGCPGHRWAFKYPHRRRSALGLRAFATASQS